jgi:hemoglobin
MRWQRILSAAACAGVFAFVLLSWGGPVAAQEKTETLYERLGGVYAIATLVDEFIERLLVNDTLNANPAINEARDRVPRAGLKFQVTAMVAQATGGPEVYAGRSMKESHAHLGINEREWQAMVMVLKATMYKFNVPDPEQGEMVAIVESLRPDIVISSME